MLVYFYVYNLFLLYKICIFFFGMGEYILLFKTIVTAIEKAKLQPKSSKRRDFFLKGHFSCTLSCLLSPRYIGNFRLSEF